MTRTLLTGGSGFIAAHVLDTLLERGHSVVTTVRSQEKGQKIKDAHPNVGSDKLDFVVVEDIAKPGAFDKAVISDPPFETVIHTASPFHFKAADAQRDLLDPAINGTVGILRAIKTNAPSVKRVVITSSFASIIDASKPLEFVFNEEHWNPITQEEVNLSQVNSYRASKTFAEKAAWKFIEEEKPSFTLATCNPPLVLGPVVHNLSTLDAINTSNERIRNFITGNAKGKPPGAFLYVDVRDIALAHVLAGEKAEAANQRFFIVAGASSNGEKASIIADAFPELKDKLPTGDYPLESSYGFDNSKSKEVLGLTYRPLRDSVVDTVKSLQRFLD